MAVINGITAERMIELQLANVVDGEVVGNDLHLIQNGGGVINAGNVRGPTGATGATGPAGADGADGEVEEAPADNDYYVRRNGVWTPIANGFKKYSAAVDHASAVVSTTPTTLATLVVSAVPVDSVLEVGAWWNAYFQDSADQFYMLIRVDGVQKAKATIRSPAANHRAVFSIPTATLVNLSATDGATVTVLAARDTTNGGSGGLIQENPGVVTAEVTPV